MDVEEKNGWREKMRRKREYEQEGKVKAYKAPS